MTKKRQARWEHQHKPPPEGEEWVECGGQRIWAAGFTEAGFPYGVTENEFRAANGTCSPEAGWARVLLPRRGCDPEIDERTQKEARLLEDLAIMNLPFRVPRVIGVCADEGHVALVRRFERGVELDLRAGRQPRVRPWDTVATLAASIHRVTTDAVPWLEPRYSTRRAHAEAAIEELDELCEPEAVDARSWAVEHLPPATPVTLVHGDLLGQNILLGRSEPDAVIDWEYAQFGDPAYDLAIVTRGVRRPFQIDRGLDRLLDSYARRAERR